MCSKKPRVWHSGGEDELVSGAAGEQRRGDNAMEEQRDAASPVKSGLV